MSLLKERFNKIADYYNLSIRKLETKCGLQRGNMSNTTGAIGSDKLAKIYDNCPEINLTWLITGKGDMLISNSVDQVNLDKIIELSTQLGKQMNENKHLNEENIKLREEIKKLTKELGEKSPVYKLPDATKP